MSPKKTKRRKLDPDPRPNVHIPLPDPTIVFNAGDLVWVWISCEHPFWPAQVQKKNFMEECMAKGRRSKKKIEIPVIRYGYKHIKDKARITVKPKHILAWDATNGDGKVIDFDNVGAEYNERMQYDDLGDWNEALFENWDRASQQAMKEFKRLKLLEENRQLANERNAREHALLEADKEQRANLSGKIYDGRDENSNGEKIGHTIRPGDQICFHSPSNPFLPEGESYIKPRVVEVYDQYKIDRLKFPLRVVGLEQVSFETEVEMVDPPAHGFFPIRKCLLIPGIAENVQTVQSELRERAKEREQAGMEVVRKEQKRRREQAKRKRDHTHELVDVREETPKRVKRKRQLEAESTNSDSPPRKKLRRSARKKKKPDTFADFRPTQKIRRFKTKRNEPAPMAMNVDADEADENSLGLGFNDEDFELFKELGMKLD